MPLTRFETFKDFLKSYDQSFQTFISDHDDALIPLGTSYDYSNYFELGPEESFSQGVSQIWSYNIISEYSTCEEGSTADSILYLLLYMNPISRKIFRDSYVDHFYIDDEVDEIMDLDSSVIKEFDKFIYKWIYIFQANFPNLYLTYSYAILEYSNNLSVDFDPSETTNCLKNYIISYLMFDLFSSVRDDRYLPTDGIKYISEGIRLYSYYSADPDYENEPSLNFEYLVKSTNSLTLMLQTFDANIHSEQLGVYEPSFEFNSSDTLYVLSSSYTETPHDLSDKHEFKAFIMSQDPLNEIKCLEGESPIEDTQSEAIIYFVYKEIFSEVERSYTLWENN